MRILSRQAITLCLVVFTQAVSADLYVEYSETMRELLGEKSIKTFVSAASAGQSNVVLFSSERAERKISGNAVIECLSEDLLSGSCAENDDLPLMPDTSATLAIVADVFAGSKVKGGAVLFSHIEGQSIAALQTLLPDTAFSLFASPRSQSGKQVFYLSFDAAALSADYLAGLAPFAQERRSCNRDCEQLSIDMSECFKAFSAAYQLPGQIKRQRYQFEHVPTDKSCDALEPVIDGARNHPAAWKKTKVKSHQEFYALLKSCADDPNFFPSTDIEMTLSLQVTRADEKTFKSLPQELKSVLLTASGAKSEAEYLAPVERIVKLAAANCR